MSRKKPVERRISESRIKAVRSKSMTAGARVDSCNRELAKIQETLDSPSVLDSHTRARLETRKVEIESELKTATRQKEEWQARHLSYIQKNYRLDGGQLDTD